MEGLHASVELIPENLKVGIRPVKLTYLFDYKEVHEGTPDGETVVIETGYTVHNEEYFIDGVQLTYLDLCKLVDDKFYMIDLEEELGKLQAKAINEYRR